MKGEKQEIPFQGVYRLDDKGGVRLLTKDLTQPNGPCLFSRWKASLRGRHEQPANIRVYDVAPDGSLSNGRIFGEEPGDPHQGVPDGIKVDRKETSL